MVCQVFGVHRSCYYDYRQRRDHVDEDREILKQSVSKLFRVSRCSAGSRTIQSMMNQQGIDVGRFKVRRLMSELGLTCKQPGSHAYKRATVERLDIPNLLDRQFKVDRPSRV
jgi:putative transposase